MRRAAGTLLVVAGLLSSPACADDDSASPFDTITTPSSDATSTTDASTDPPTSTTTDAAPAAELEWEDCGFEVECATLTVPLDYADPDGPTVELALARRPADRPDERVGAILVNPGGPGGSGVSLITDGFTAGGELDSRFDLVSWDPRGVGASTPVECGGATLEDWLGTDPAPDDGGEVDALHAAAEALADECADVDGSLLGHVSTLDTVEDLDRIREALREDQISYLGLSYGTFIGQLYLEAHPDRVRAMVLDGVMDPADPLPDLADAQAGGFEEAFAEMADWCADDDDCAVDDPVAAYEELADRVEEAPIPGGGRDIGPAELQVGTEAALYSSAAWPDLAAGLADALEGDGEILGFFVDGYYSSASFTAYAAVVCLDFGPPDLAGFDDLAVELEERHPHFGAGLGYELLPCAYWPVPPVRTPAPVTSPDGAPPVLSIGGLRDPATPIAEAIDVASRLDGELLRFDSDGHVAIHESDCIDGWIESYFLDLTLPPPDTVC